MVFHEGCYCTSKARKSESNSQPVDISFGESKVVIALAKLENLKAIHNFTYLTTEEGRVVIALAKLENLKAIHNGAKILYHLTTVVIALAKLENLKAIHNMNI